MQCKALVFGLHGMPLKVRFPLWKMVQFQFGTHMSDVSLEIFRLCHKAFTDTWYWIYRKAT